MVYSVLKSFRRGPAWVRGLAWGALLFLVVAILRVSWLRWMDPVVDFGRELYIPWRIVEGEHPGRDFVHLYGPFSAYFNAGLFSVFGVALQTLVGSNLVLFAVILTSLFVIGRRAFGFFPSVVAVAVAIPVFGFPHYTVTGNYTYAAPYSHEATHGMLFLMLNLVWLTSRGCFSSVGRGGWGFGFLAGLGCLTKSEYVLVTGLLWAASVARLWSDPGLRPVAWRWVLGSIGGGTLVLGGAWALLLTALPAADAARSAGNAFIAPLAFRALSSSPLGLTLLGADRLGENLLRLLLAGGAMLALLGGLVWIGRRAARSGNRAATVGWLGLVGVLVAAAMLWLPWRKCATLFPALLIGGMAVRWMQRTHGRGEPVLRCPRTWNQGIYALAAAGMLARMAFDPRVNHYGFFQAMLAGTWVVAFLVGVWPQLVGPSQAMQRTLMLAALLVIGTGVTWLWQRSLHYYRSIEHPIGAGADRMYGFRPDVHDLSRAWESARAHIAATTSPDSTLLVVPEGLSMNYWTRRKHPLRILDVLPATLTLNRGDVLEELKAHPPDAIVLVTRDMEEFGYRTYGQDEASGRALLDWINGNYAVEAKAGDYPFTPGKAGLWFLRRRPR